MFILKFICCSLLVWRIIHAKSVRPPNPYDESNKCEKLDKESPCSDLPYGETKFPNLLGQATQAEAIKAMNPFAPLIRFGCSQTLQLFLCSVYFPVCAKYSEGISPEKKILSPCRSLCQQNRLKCTPIINKYNFKWPPHLNCDRFPEDSLCIKENTTDSDVALHSMSTCPAPLRISSTFDFKVTLPKSTLKNCGIPCKQYFFNDTHLRNFARIWIGLWSLLCVISSLFTILTFLIDRKRFQYPERPIIFLSFCYFFVACTYMVGSIVETRFACTKPFRPPDLSDISEDKMPDLIVQGTKFEFCVVMFMVLYFFSMASNIWWVVLTITWYLAAKCHWAHESIASKSQYFHLAAWAIPAGKTIAILLWGKIEGDPLSGVCFIGVSDMAALRYFIIGPLCVYLVIGTSFLIAGFVSLFKIRTIIKNEGAVKADKLEKLIMRIGLFSVLYIVPAILIIGITIHESEQHNSWMSTWYADLCRTYKIYMPTTCIEIEKNVESIGGASKLAQPEFELIMIKYLMQLIIGITSSIWIWSRKTIFSWNVLFNRCCCVFRRNVPSQPHGLLLTSPYDNQVTSVPDNQGYLPQPHWNVQWNETTQSVSYKNTDVI